jgi:streptogramin lyase
MKEAAEDPMTLQLSGDIRIHNLRDYPAEVVADLRATLAAGASARPDPHRSSFYDLSGGLRGFYIHLAPDGSVWLLASWIERAPATTESASLLAACV